MTEEEYISLYEKFLAGKCSPEEERMLLQYKDELEFNDHTWDKYAMGDKETTRSEVFENIKAVVLRKRMKKLYYQYAAAAILIVVLSLGLIFFKQPATDQSQVVSKVEHQVKDDALPGGNKAILTLGDGSEIVLDSSKVGVLTTQGKTIISKITEGELSYSSRSVKQNKYELNTITTPLGGEYMVELADGSKVWLNSGSSLTFPTTFTGDVRSVRLKGEAYFEIAKNAKSPFHVEVNSMQVKVLGTHFNIMAYNNEAAIKTTLFEGSVRLVNGLADEILKPGQEGVLGNNGKISVREADLEAALAWKNGYFYFDKADIGMIMRQLSRWYDVQVVYQGKVPKNLFVGKISRKSKLSEVLDMLKFAKVRFEIKDQQITIIE